MIKHHRQWTCPHCLKRYNHRLTYQKHRCTYEKYDKVYRTKQEFCILHNYFPIGIAIEVLRYVYNTKWSNRSYWHQRYHRLHAFILSTNDTLSSRYSASRVIFSWFLIIPLHIIGHNFKDRVRRTSIYDRRRLFLQPLLITPDDHIILCHAITQLVHFFRDMEEVYPHFRIPPVLTTFLKQWRRKTRILV